MAKNTELLIASTNLWAGISLLSLLPFDTGTMNFTSLSNAELKIYLVLWLMEVQLICQFSWTVAILCLRRYQYGTHKAIARCSETFNFSQYCAKHGTKCTLPVYHKFVNSIWLQCVKNRVEVGYKWMDLRLGANHSSLGSNQPNLGTKRPWVRID